MAKASPIIRSFNAGEVSILIEGRTDLDRYPASMRSLENYIAAPQGPAIPRSGTQYLNRVYNNAEMSILVPFVFSETDFYMLEFANQRVRFFLEEGLLTYAPVAVTAMSAGPFVFTSATLAANIGDEVAFSLFPEEYNLNGVVAKITAKTGDDYTVDVSFPALATLITFKVARVYHISSPYNSTTIKTLQDTPSLDVVYLTNTEVPPYKLLRADTYSWSFELVDFQDGPYMPVNETKTTITPNVTGKATPTMTASNAPAGNVVTASTENVSYPGWHAFDDPELDSSWLSTTNQAATLQIQVATGFIADGYTIYVTHYNLDTNFSSKDYSPVSWTFEGSNDGSTWIVLDRQNDYVLYDQGKSVFFEIPNATSYTYYRINVREVFRSGAVKVSFKSLIIRSTVSRSITLTANSTTGINNGQGFLATDVGRLIRMRGSEGTWRELKITARNSSTEVVADLRGEPFSSLLPMQNWRLGYWSDTTGYPNCACFFQDRLWFGGSASFPDLVVGSVVGRYEVMSPTESDGVVGDSNALAVRLNSRRLSRVKWMAGGKGGLLLGTGSQEYVIRPNGSDKTITPLSIKADEESARGSSGTPPAIVDKQVLYCQRSGRTIREFAYNYEVDGYKSPSMSSLASHLGVSPFVKMAYAPEPYSIVWMLRANGTLVGLTYNRDENVVGWHRHKFPNNTISDVEVDGVIESIAVIPASNQLQDILWMVIRRVVNGSTVRYVEKLTQFWDFGMALEDAHYVDCALRYLGDATDTVYGLGHLEGHDNIYGLADGIPVGPFTIIGGKVVLPSSFENIILGIGFDASGETSRLENGAQDGTAQGKTKRINNISMILWDSYGGEVGVFNEDEQVIQYSPVEYPVYDASTVDTVNLFSGVISDIVPIAGYEKRGSVAFRRRKEEPVPFIPIAFMPQMVTQDR